MLTQSDTVGSTGAAQHLLRVAAQGMLDIPFLEAGGVLGVSMNLRDGLVHIPTH